MKYLKKCTISDLNTLLWISKETFIAAFEKDNQPEYFQQYIEGAFTEDNLKNQLENEASHFYFVLERDELIGYLKLNYAKAQTDIRDYESIELQRIYVLEKYQGKRVGQWMLEKAIEICSDEANIKYMWLGVWEHNTKAIRFYERNGFQKFGEHSFFIGKDEQIDWLMRLNFQ